MNPVHPEKAVLYIHISEFGSVRVPLRFGHAQKAPSLIYFTELGISGNIREKSLSEMYNSEYFTNIRNLNVSNSCSSCNQYSICKSGCIGQKIIANYTQEADKEKVLRRCINSRDPKCMR